MRSLGFLLRHRLRVCSRYWLSRSPLAAHTCTSQTQYPLHHRLPYIGTPTRLRRGPCTNFCFSQTKRPRNATHSAADESSRSFAGDITAVAVETSSAMSTAHTRSSSIKMRCSTPAGLCRVPATTAGPRIGSGRQHARAEPTPQALRAATAPVEGWHRRGQSLRVYSFPSHAAWRRPKRKPTRSAAMWAACPAIGTGARSNERALPILSRNGRPGCDPKASF